MKSVTMRRLAIDAAISPFDFRGRKVVSYIFMSRGVFAVNKNQEWRYDEI